MLVVPLAAVAIGLTTAVVAPSTANAVTIDTNAWYQIVSRHSGLALDVVGASTADGAGVVQWAQHNRQNQQFRFIDSGNGYYRIQARHSGKVLDVWEWNPANGAEIRQFTDLNGTNQQFQVIDTDSGHVKFINRFSGKALDVWEWSTANGGRISQFDDIGGWNQQWRLAQVGGSGVPYSNVPDGFAQGTTGGAGGPTVTVSTQAALEQAVGDNTPRIVRVSGTITVQPFGRGIRVGSNKTIVGVGTSGQIAAGGFLVINQQNVIIRNLTIRDSNVPSDPCGADNDYDGIRVDNSRNIWLDHNHVTNAGDGLVDIRRDTDNITVSWNIISRGCKAVGVGWTPNVVTKVTFHHNWFRDNQSRNPNIDNVVAGHLYNNYWQNITGNGAAPRGAAKIVVENSYFDNVRHPLRLDSTNAELVARGNIMVNVSGSQQTRGSAFNPSSYYSYQLDPASQVPNLVTTYAGPQASITG